MEGKRLINVAPTYRPFGSAKLVDPGVPGNSLLLTRLASTDPAMAMPPTDRHRVDAEAVALLTRWIAGLPAASPENPPTP